MHSLLDGITDRQLLDVRLCDLPLKIEGTRLEQRMEKLYRELNARSIAFKPHVWLGEEWFTPDGVAGFAIPFYLAHPRLMKLERAQMLEVEGASEGECMRILRHEAAHALAMPFGCTPVEAGRIYSAPIAWTTPNGTSLSPAAAITCLILMRGTGRRIQQRTSQKRSRYG